MTQKFRGAFLVLGAIAIAAVWATPAIAQMSDELAARLSENVDQPVIVILKSQHAIAPKGSVADLQRSNAIASEQAPLMDEFRQVHAVKIKNYRLVNALAATVSKGEVERLKANPAVAQVVPDVVMPARSSRMQRPLGSPNRTPSLPCHSRPT